jgi:N-acyl-D-amino-acid deacylase
MAFDVIIRGGTVIDGTGAPGRRADVALQGDRIAAIEAPGGLDAAADAAGAATTTIDATGRVVAPGFIDVHSHTEIALPQDGAKGRFANVLQGVTTIMTAPDGLGWAPLPAAKARDLWPSTLFATGPGEAFDFEWDTVEQFLAIFKGRVPENVVPMAPHNAIRFAAMGWAPRLATPKELDQIKRHLREWMDAGAVGLNTGLDYQPGANSDTDELLALCRVVKDEYDGMYASHMRYSGAGLAGAFREIMRLTRETGIPVSIAHFNNDGESADLLAEAEREGGLDFSFESYMYPAGSTHFLMTLPLEDQVGGPDALQERMQDPAYRDRLLGHVNLNLDRPQTERARAYFSDTRTGRFIGRTIPEAASDAGISVPEFVRMLVDEELPEALLVYHRGYTDEEFAPTVRATIQHPRMMVASDGIAHAALPHPRGAGCFARVLRYQVRELGAVTLEEAIRKMTGFAAERYGLTDIGRLEAGRRADVVVFDPETAGDRATWDEPRLEPVGIDAVLVNGVVVADHGRWTGALPGEVLRKG